jgi:putative aldouronate transport system substrate-binding protein
MRKRNFLAIMLTICMLLTMMFTLTGASAEAVDPYGPVASEKTVIHVGREETANVTYPEGENSHDNYIVKYLSEKLNVEYVYDFSVDTASYETKIAMAIASGDMPEVMVVNYTQLRQLVEADAIEDMTATYNTYVSPKLSKAFESTNGISYKLSTFDGKMMAIPNMFPGMDTIPLLYIRGDWMEELGLSDPKSLDDVISIANAFKEKNPGGNVTSGLVVSKEPIQEGGGQYNVNALFALYGAAPKHWIEKDGEIVYGSITKEARTALEKIRELVKNGVIDASFAVRDSAQCTEMIHSGQAGMYYAPWWNGQALVSMLEKAPDSVHWNMYLVPTNPDGTYDVYMKTPTTNYIVVKKGCSEDVKEAVVKTVNYQYDLDQDQALAVRPNGMDTPFSWHYYPINTLHCDYDAKEVQIQSVMDCIDGKIAYDDLSGDGKTWYNGYTTVVKDGFRAAVNKNISTANAWGWASGAWEVQRNSAMINRINDVTYAKTPTMETEWATLETMEDEVYLQILTGDTDITAFDEFVANWKALGGDTITQEVKDIAAGN